MTLRHFFQETAENVVFMALLTIKNLKLFCCDGNIDQSEIKKRGDCAQTILLFHVVFLLYQEHIENSSHTSRSRKREKSVPDGRDPPGILLFELFMVILLQSMMT